jgi:hypothetical protein
MGCIQQRHAGTDARLTKEPIVTVEERVEEILSRKWIVRVWGTCSDTGKYESEFRFETLEEAEECYGMWLDDREDGLLMSDGPQHMEPPVHESQLRMVEAMDRKVRQSGWTMQVAGR